MPKFIAVALVAPALVGLSAPAAAAGEAGTADMQPCLKSPVTALSMAAVTAATMNPNNLGSSCQMMTKLGVTNVGNLGSMSK